MTKTAETPVIGETSHAADPPLKSLATAIIKVINILIFLKKLKEIYIYILLIYIVYK
jgi:hypothetical protein